jgi:uncharacterized protein (TIRG00374 family)
LLRSVRVWIGIGISVLFLGLFLKSTDFGEIKSAFEDANYYVAVASLPVYFLGIWVRTIRWQYLLRPIKRLSVWRLYPVVIIGLMANNLIPARVGEFVRAYILGERENVSKAASLGTIAVDRLFDGLTLVPMMLILIAFVGSGESFQVPFGYHINLLGLSAVMAALFGAALAVLFVLAFSAAWRDRADALIMRLAPERFRDGLEGLAHSFFEGLHSLRSPVDLAIAWIMSTVSWLLEATMYYIVGLAFHIHVGFQYYLLVTAAANLAISVLASQGGIGPFEVVTKQTFVAAGVSPVAKAQSFAIALHALVLLPVIAVGLYFLTTMGFSLGEIFRRSTSTGPGGPTDDRLLAALPSDEG